MKMRYKNVELRQQGVPDSHEYIIAEDRPNEIVSWTYDENSGKEYCITICWLKRDKEGYYMETVGNRYVEYEDMEALNHVAKYSLRVLNTHFEFETNRY
jgi:hypothetical protein